MIDYFTLLLFPSFFFLLTTQAAAQHSGNKFFDSRKKVEHWLKDNHVPALGIGIIREGGFREIKMYGELRKNEPAPVNAIFNVASLTKPVVAMLTLKLVNDGNWDLDEPLDHYWVDPDIANDPRHKKLTTRLVLSHQTGFKNWRWLHPSGKLAFDFDPGSKFQYSGEGFEYLRKALERKFSKPIEQLTDSLIFSPLGMEETRHAWDQYTDESRFARWHDTGGINAYLNHQKTSVSAADDLLTTIEDYGKFALHVLTGAGLDTAVYSEMIRPHVSTGGDRFMGLGWEMFLDLGPKKEYALTHSGSDQGVQTLVILLPISKQGLIIFTNGDNGYKLYEKIIVEILDIGREMMNRVK